MKDIAASATLLIIEIRGDMRGSSLSFCLLTSDSVRETAALDMLGKVRVDRRGSSFSYAGRALSLKKSSSSTRGYAD